MQRIKITPAIDKTRELFNKKEYTNSEINKNIKYFVKYINLTYEEYEELLFEDETIYAGLVATETIPNELILKMIDYNINNLNNGRKFAYYICTMDALKMLEKYHYLRMTEGNTLDFIPLFCTMSNTPLDVCRHLVETKDENSLKIMAGLELNNNIAESIALYAPEPIKKILAENKEISLDIRELAGSSFL